MNLSPILADNPPAFPKDKALRVVIAGGGTGGHIFPGIAMARAFAARNSGTQILFVGTGNRFERQALAGLPFSHTAIPAEGIKGRGVFRKLGAVIKIPIGVAHAVGVLGKFGADLVVGVGGYSSGPVVMGAFLMRIPIVLQEQNLLPGMANRVLGRLAKRIYLSFENTAPVFDSKKVLVTGNPVRPEIASYAASSGELGARAGKEDRFTVLVCGGSQGAHAINRAVMDALAHLRNQPVDLIHQTGVADEAAVREAYETQGLSFRVSAFYENMAAQYALADLVICRAGATTVAELTAMGKPALFIPYPHAADQHQALNAKSMADAGAAEMIHESVLTGQLLADRITYYAADSHALARMAERSGRLGRPGAAEAIVDDCYRLLMETPSRKTISD
ncbi:MAG: undecaprenyldiphospho-muramoylpentapeptide beta-N-acetylglucosaminyltransferase [Desulfobacterales bacterium]|jgi:UDP-N-acetylglucosamine--N-acetylmuramyl-(pentapeptide) pyrophosphoryl-undecaprenol N-acetylglucosamine transferase|nr:undecaprenyldiphospho-muramoylpentapeptide beta-N-acetylglucosaminyltransferase [Desulfobacterales bacterium]